MKNNNEIGVITCEVLSVFGYRKILQIGNNSKDYVVSYLRRGVDAVGFDFFVKILL